MSESQEEVENLPMATMADEPRGREGWITADHLADGSVVGGEGGAVLDDTISEHDLRSGSVIGGQGGDVGDESLTSFDLGAGSVGTSEVDDHSVAAIDLAPHAVIGRAVASDSSLVNVKLGTISGEGADTTWAVTGDIALGTITGQGDNDDSLVAGADNEWVTGNLGLWTVGRRNLVDGAVDATKLSTTFLGELVTEDELTALLLTMKSDEAGATAPKQPNDGDGFVHWNHLESIPAGIADGNDDDGGSKVQQLEQKLDGDGTDVTPNDSNDLVSFNEVKDLTSSDGDGRITGTFIANGTISAADLGGSSVESDEIKDGEVKTVDLAGDDVDDPGVPGDERAPGAVTSEKIALNTIEAVDIGTGAVESDELAQDSVGASEIQDGTITTEELKANAEVAVNPAVTTLTTAVSAVVVSTPITIPTSPTSGNANHKILLTGQATLDCTGCTAPISVQYTLGEGGVAIPGAPVMAATVDSANGDIVLPVSFITIAAQGPHTYDLLVTGTFAPAGSAVVKSATLNAVDLGRA